MNSTDRPAASDGRAGRPALLTGLAALLFLEAAGALALVVAELLALVSTRGDAPYATGIALVVLAALAVVWAGATGIGALRARRWIRGSAVTWQILQLAVAVAIFQGLFASPLLGWTLLVAALVGLALAISPPVAAAVTASREDPEDP